jgi:hypothetical protein
VPVAPSPKTQVSDVKATWPGSDERSMNRIVSKIEGSNGRKMNSAVGGGATLRLNVIGLV